MVFGSIVPLGVLFFALHRHAVPTEAAHTPQGLPENLIN